MTRGDSRAIENDVRPSKASRTRVNRRTCGQPGGCGQLGRGQEVELAAFEEDEVEPDELDEPEFEEPEPESDFDEDEDEDESDLPLVDSDFDDESPEPPEFEFADVSEPDFASERESLR